MSDLHSDVEWVAYMDQRLAEEAAKTTGTCDERMNQLGARFGWITPRELGQALYAAGKITTDEYTAIASVGFVFDIDKVELSMGD